MYWNLYIIIRIKFDDSKVSSATKRNVFEENFTGKHPEYSTAAVLVYIKIDKIPEILQELNIETDIPHHLRPNENV